MTRRSWLALLAASAADEVAILPLGDSITAGSKDFPTYRPLLAARLREAGLRIRFTGSQRTAGEPEELRHEGHGGKNIEFLAARIEQVLRDHPADIVLLHAGHNHFAEEHPVPGIIAATKQIISAARRSNPKMQFLLAQVIPSGKLPKYSYLPELNRELARVAAELKVILVDQATGFDVETDTIADRVHPNASGAAKMAERWFAALRPLLAAPR
ncbi:MAG: GDSL-type esterase/lipase family protein [Bryobacter sp.]|jgi:lysophospholipase L1-like esterase|nr:GDSL-type esterase/lipase family protein [Bryobacter sp.]